MYYRFEAIPETEFDPMFSKVRRIIQVQMCELGLNIDRDKIESLMKSAGLKPGQIQFWFTKKGYNQVGKHLPAQGKMFKWFRVPEIHESLVVYKDKLQVACKQLIIGKKQSFDNHSSL